MCISLSAVLQFAIWAVVAIAVFAIINLLISQLAGVAWSPFAWPAVPPQAGAPNQVSPLAPFLGLLISIIRIVFWAAIMIGILYLVFDLLSCLVGIPRLR